MSTDATKSDTPSSSGAARMRLHRKRRKNGLRHVRIMLHVTEIDALVRKGYLPRDEREDIWALQIAICDLLDQVLLHSDVTSNARGAGEC